jgi:tetratricopeptide (TPR) repeat protein
MTRNGANLMAVLAVLTAGCTATGAHNEVHDHATMSSSTMSSGTSSGKPVTLMAGLGNWRHPIATRSPEAQKYFDQGLVLVYGFNREEALRSFRKAAELDPKAPMAYWGIAMARGPYVNLDGDPTYQMKESCKAIDEGLAIPDINATERAWLEAARTRCPDYADPSKYIAAMRSLATKLPDDPDAQTFYAESLLIPVRWKWYVDGKPGDGVAEAENVLQTVLRRYPQHAGANHLYIHAVESSPTPERAVPSAQRLMGIVPAAGHIVHMPGHIWLAIGDYNQAASVNERAIEVDRQYFAQSGISNGAYSMYYMHNIGFLTYARSMEGRSAETVKAANELADAVAPMQNTADMADMVDMASTFVTLWKLRVERWDEVVSTPRPARPLAEAFWNYARAVADMAKSDRTAAAAEQAEFEKIAKTLNRNTQWSTNQLGGVLDLASASLTARLGGSAAMWKRAVDAQDALTYDEPPGWYYPVRESLGAALLRSGDAAGAETVFREGLRRSPNNGRMLFGLAESLKAQKKTEAAAWVESEFRHAWDGADIQLTLGDL